MLRRNSLVLAGILAIGTLVLSNYSNAQAADSTVIGGTLYEEVVSSHEINTRSLYIPLDEYPNHVSGSKCEIPRAEDFRIPWMPGWSKRMISSGNRGDDLYAIGPCGRGSNDIFHAREGAFDTNSWISTTSGPMAGWATAPYFVGFHESYYSDDSTVIAGSEIANGTTEFYSDPIWANSDDDMRDFSYALFGDMNFGRWNLYSNGTSLFRQKFTMSQQDIDDLRSGKSQLVIEAAADDWYMLYINGVPIRAKTYAREPLNPINIDSSNLVPGENMVAFQVIDKARWNSSYTGIGFGFRYSMYTTQPAPPPADYVLTPSVSTDPTGGETVAGGDNVDVDPQVDKTGPTDSNDTEWQLTVMYFDPGETPPAPPSGGEYWNGGNSVPKDFFENTQGAENLSILDSGMNKIFATSSDDLNGVQNFTIPAGLPTGTWVCFALSVDPFGAGASGRDQWRHSELSCLLIEETREPKVQIHGGDLRVNGEIITSVTKSGSPARTFGSWVEYGVFSSGVNNHASSGAGLSGGRPLSPAAWSALTFANTAGFGGFGDLHVSHSAASYFKGLSEGKNQTANSFDVHGKNGVYDFGNENVSVHGSVANGNSVVILTTGNVTIDDDITYSSAPISSLADIPQVVIVAGNINIQADVDRIDAWLLADRVIDTCAGHSGDEIATDCKNTLRVNGPVVSDSLLLKRSAGAKMGDPTLEDAPAELFNLRPDAFLWAHVYTNKTQRAQTVYLTEAPPRF